ncbi:MAG: hypothetical protein FDX30_07805 [Chlorobium sp.]|nr:MAG: hypothetical protein FDX30_07805 [Chlorobium sp.]
MACPHQSNSIKLSTDIRLFSIKDFGKNINNFLLNHFDKQSCFKSKKIHTHPPGSQGCSLSEFSLDNSFITAAIKTKEQPFTAGKAMA